VRIVSGHGEAEFPVRLVESVARRKSVWICQITVAQYPMPSMATNSTGASARQDTIDLPPTSNEFDRSLLFGEKLGLVSRIHG
jgi:hypothetical protein